MNDVSFALQAKSDQLNAVDIIGSEPILKITRVQVASKTEQPVSVFFEGDNGRPWKPSKGMLRIIAAAWGTDSKNWVGKSLQVYFEPSVKYAGVEVGGIRICRMSDIPKTGIDSTIAIARGKREPYRVTFLDTNKPAYPQDKFDAALPAMIEKMKSGAMSLQQIIAKCQQTGELTPEQIKVLESNAPLSIDEDENQI